METFIRDVRLGLRLLLNQPGFFLIAVLTLSVGIGGSTAIFSVIDAALLRPLPYPAPDRMVDIHVDERQRDGRVFGLSPSVEDVRDWQEHQRVFSDIGIWRTMGRPVVVDGPEPERVNLVKVSEGLLGVYGVAPFLGRGFTREDTREGTPPVALLGYSYWQQRFGRDESLLGRVIRIDGEPATIVGVVPQNFFPEYKLWLPLQTTAPMIARRGTGTSIHARLRPGVSIDQAQAITRDFTAHLDRERGRGQDSVVRIDSLYESETAGYWTTTNILATAVAFILAIACVNVAGLLLARGAVRRPELAIRASLGAGRTRLIRQLLTESLLLSVAGGAAGVLIAWLTLDLLVSNIPLILPSNSPVAINARVLAFSIGLSLVSGLTFGLVPALKLSDVKISEALAGAGHRHGSALSRRGGQVLIAVEVALALVLLAGGGLMIRSFARILAVDVGFDPQAVLTMEVAPIDPKKPVLREYYPALVQLVRTLPGVEAAGAVDHLPLAGSSTGTRAMVDGRPVPIGIRQFLPGYFEAVGFSLREGRYPTDVNITAGPALALLNEQGARQMFPDGSAIGRQFEALKTAFQVVGVVGDVRHRGPMRPVEPEAYLLFSRVEAKPLIVVVRPKDRGAVLGEQLRQAAHAIGPRVIVDGIRSGSDWLSDRIVTPRRRTVLLGLLAGIGLVLALVGVFGATAYAVARRTQEIGVRMAFGARAGQVVGVMVRDSIWPVVIGIVVGLGMAGLATRVIASFLFETAPTDPLTFVGVALILALAAACAAWIPARRAARVDPVTALRTQ